MNARLADFLARDKRGNMMLRAAVALLPVVVLLSVLNAHDSISTAVAMALGGLAGTGAAVLWIAGSFKVAAAFAPQLVNLLTFVLLTTALLFVPRYLILDLTGVERQCTVVRSAAGERTTTRYGTGIRNLRLTVDCPGGRYDLVAGPAGPAAGDRVPVTFDRAGIVRPELTGTLPGSTWWMWPLVLLPVGCLYWFRSSMRRERRRMIDGINAFEGGTEAA